VQLLDVETWDDTVFVKNALVATSSFAWGPPVRSPWAVGAYARTGHVRYGPGCSKWMLGIPD